MNIAGRDCIGDVHGVGQCMECMSRNEAKNRYSRVVSFSLCMQPVIDLGKFELSAGCTLRTIACLEGGWLLLRCRSSVAEHWRLKPEALGLIPGGATFPFKPPAIQRSADSAARLCL